MSHVSGLSRSARMAQNDVQPEKTQARDRSQSVQIASGHARSGSDVDGLVAMDNAPASHGSDAVQGDSKGRLSQFKSAIGDAFRSVAAKMHKDVGQAAPNAKDAKFDAIATSRQELRDMLGAENDNGILKQNITTKQGTAPLEHFMSAYVSTLGKGHQISTQEAMTFVRMGERIVGAMNQGSDKDFKLPLSITMNGETKQIPANLDTARAVSWYLAAKGMADNASPVRDAVQMHSASMTLSDPGNRMHKFLSSAPNCYGRCSSHHATRTARDGEPPAGSKPGWSEKLLMKFGGQPLQNGMEDFTNKFPSNGGTLLFARLKDGSGGGELMLKWEKVGMPNAFDAARHGDTREEKATFMMAAGRCKGHMVNFMNRHEAKFGVARGEQAAKLIGKDEVKGFAKLVEKSNLSDSDKKKYALNSDKQNIPNMLEGLAKLKQDCAASGKPTITIDSLETNIEDMTRLQGEDLGIARAGAEVHASRV